VDLVVTGCLGFNPSERRLYLLDDEGWPGVMQSYLEADYVVTPDGVIDLEIPQSSTFNFVT
jgi:hypothetical protein